jgi:hypothetical protein
MAEMKPYPIRLSDDDRKALADVAKYHQRNYADMIRVLIRNEHARVFKAQTAPRPLPLPADDVDDFDIVDD